MPIQQMLLGAGGAVAPKTYVDDVFSTFLYEGNETQNRSITNSIDLSGEGGLVWLKGRSVARTHLLYDTERGASKPIESSGTSAEWTNTSLGVVQFNNNGFNLGSHQSGNWDGEDFSSWTFRKAPGFFDIVTYDGNGTAGRQISHNLGCKPGLIIVKRYLMGGSSAANWAVYHRDLTAHKWLRLNSDLQAFDYDNIWYDTEPTSTHFTVGNEGEVNASSSSEDARYVAYLFAGGEEGYNSVEFDGTGDKLSIASHADLQIGSSTYTMEFWVFKNADTPNDYDCWAAKGSNNNGTREFAIESMADQTIDWYYATSGGSWSVVEDVSDGAISNNQWVHICAQKDSNGYFSFFVNGTRTYYSTTGAETLNTGADPFCIAGFADANTSFESNVKISNFRFIKGTALYSSSFTPSTTPLTNVTNTKLLCCNGDLPTSSTVTPGTITANGDTHTTGTSPFTSPDAVFGESGSESVIKCGSYTTDSNEDATVHLGWEPQWVLAKRTDSSTGGDWFIIDSMRGFMNAQDIEANNGGSKYVEPNTSDAEADTSRMGLTSTGFYADQYGANRSFIYLAIRRPDGYVGKPYGAGEGTSVFAMDTGNSSSTIPTFDSGFPVDMGLFRRPASSEDWTLINRLTGDMRLKTNTNAAEASSGSEYAFDSNTGFMAASWANTNYQAWMWKRHAGFTVCAWEGDGVIGRQIAHDMNKIPEMIWLKKRTGTARNWPVYHKGLDGGSSPEEKVVWLNLTNAESDSLESWNNTAPTSTHFTIHGTANEPNTNSDGEDYIAMLFASVDGISSVGSYNGSSSNVFVTTGFQPRFVIIKNSTDSGDWFVLDTTRGWGSGNDNYLMLQDTDAQGSLDVGAPTSTGFTVNSVGGFNSSGNSYIYYAHA